MTKFSYIEENVVKIIMFSCLLSVIMTYGLSIVMDIKTEVIALGVFSMMISACVEGARKRKDMSLVIEGESLTVYKCDEVIKEFDLNKVEYNFLNWGNVKILNLKQGKEKIVITSEHLGKEQFKVFERAIKAVVQIKNTQDFTKN